MTLVLHREDLSNISVELNEWSQRIVADDERLKSELFGCNTETRQVIDGLRGRVNIRPGFTGIEIETVDPLAELNVGPLRIAIGPKLPAMPLLRLLRFAYGLRDLYTHDEVRSPMDRHGLHDLLILLLAAEIEELLHGGLRHQYISFTEKLESPRGHILLDSLVRGGGVREARLPCRYFERRIDWRFNQVLRTGVLQAAVITDDPTLRLRMLRLARMFGDVTPISNFTTGSIEHAERELTRLTSVCKPALTIIRLLHEMMGTALNSGNETNVTPGFLFDMNIFFQRLLSRFLIENLTSVRIADEKKIRNLFAYVKGNSPETS